MARVEACFGETPSDGRPRFLASVTRYYLPEVCAAPSWRPSATSSALFALLALGVPGTRATCAQDQAMRVVAAAQDTPFHSMSAWPAAGAAGAQQQQRRGAPRPVYRTEHQEERVSLLGAVRRVVVAHQAGAGASAARRAGEPAPDYVCSFCYDHVTMSLNPLRL